MEKEKKSERIKSPEYRIFIGKNLREQRINEGYTLNDVQEMTEIPINTLVGIEKGQVTNIDYYVEYGKAVKYPLATLTQAEIKMQSAKELPKERLKAIKLTKEIRVNIILTGFLSVGKGSQQIKEELERLKVIPKDTITTSEIAGVMRNLKADDIVKIESRSGNKNTYIIKK
ncbi:helix-turn-helix domain-containing protein [Sphingobacterium sp. NGMCC 1.201703]|uniref:helix-turn-helix domain-containing protein n=1 Tax=Sphingobacterium sp. NGMCC 1.201703 TaxID=3388657 RepID=UPI0039FCDD41